MPPLLRFSECDIIEAKVIDGVAYSWLIRMPFNKQADLVMSVCFNRDNHEVMIVKTCWLNHVTDHHATLRTEYETE